MDPLFCTSADVRYEESLDEPARAVATQAGTRSRAVACSKGVQDAMLDRLELLRFRCATSGRL